MKKVILIVVALTLILSAFTGCSKSNVTQQSNEVSQAELSDKPMAKVAVNISGEITEISEDGKKIKVGDKWVIIDENTIFEDDPDNGVKAVSKEFKVGNVIQGYTADDTSKEEVKAYQIYTNN